MDRVTIRLPDELSARLSREAARAGISRSRWVRELVIERLSFSDGVATATELDERLRRIEAELFGRGDAVTHARTG